MPTEIYNLAGQSHVTYSFEVPSYTMEVNVMGLLNILNAIVQCKLKDHVRLYQVEYFFSASYDWHKLIQPLRLPHQRCFAAILKLLSTKIQLSIHSRHTECQSCLHTFSSVVTEYLMESSLRAEYRSTMNLHVEVTL